VGGFVVRKWAALLLIFLGAFLVVTAGVAKLWGQDAAERTPLNVNTYTYLTGEADKLNPETGKLEHVPVKYQSLTQADPDKSDGDVVAFVNTKCINIDRDDPPPCLPDTDDRLIINVVDTFATDRHTALSVNESKYLGKDAVPHEGLVNKWPFNAEKKTYPYWDGILGKAVNAEYVGTRDIDGLDTYEYDVNVPETEVDEVLEGTPGTYSTVQKTWIDPKTGSIIDQEGGQIRKLEDGTKILDIHVAYTDDTVQTNVDDAKSNGKSLTMIGTIVPIVGLVLGLIFLAVGALLIRNARSRGRRVASSSSSVTLSKR
jgi:Porin PorA